MGDIHIHNINISHSNHKQGQVGSNSNSHSNASGQVGSHSNSHSNASDQVGSHSNSHSNASGQVGSRGIFLVIAFLVLVIHFLSRYISVTEQNCRNYHDCVARLHRIFYRFVWQRTMNVPEVKVTISVRSGSRLERSSHWMLAAITMVPFSNLSQFHRERESLTRQSRPRRTP